MGNSLRQIGDDRPASMTDIAETSEFRPFETPSWPVANAEISSVFRAMWEDGSWGRYHGPHCEMLRAALQEFHQVDHAVLCSSGTAAVELALRSVPVQAGDEVIMCAYDFKANFMNVVLLGAIPVLVDTKPGSPVIDADQIMSACTSRTRAILVSHLHGAQAQVDQIRSLADARGITLIEDACQNPGALWALRRVATWGHLGILSFGGSKLLTCGRGGAVISNDASAIQRIRLYTHRGNESYPLSEMQAAVVLPQLRQLDEYNARRLEAAQRFTFGLQESSRGGRHDFRALVDDDAEDNFGESRPAFYKLAIRCEESFPAAFRARLCENARSLGIPISPAFSGLHLIHSRKRFRTVDDLPHATLLHQRLMSLHHTALLTPEAELRRMADVLIQLAARLEERP